MQTQIFDIVSPPVGETDLKAKPKGREGAHPSKQHSATRKLLPLLLLIFIDSFSYFIVIPVLLQLFFNHQYHLIPDTTSLKNREILIGLVIGTSSLATLISAPIIGYLSDRYGRKKILGVCLLSVSLGFALPILGIIHNLLFLIILGRFLAGLGSASQAIAQASVADIYQDQDKNNSQKKSINKSRAFGLIALMMTLPIILGPFAGGYLSDPNIISWLDIKTPYYFSLGLSLLNFFLLILFFRETLNLNQTSNQNLKTNLKLKASSQKFPANIFNLFWQLKFSIKTYSIGLFVFLFFSLEFVWSFYYQTISLFLSQKFLYSAQKISLFYTLMGLVMSLGLVLIYPVLIKFFKIKNIMITSFILVISSLFISFLFKQIPETQWVFSPIISIFTGITYVSLVSLISEKIPDDQQGWIMGYLSTLLFLAWMMTGFLSGFVI